MATLLPSLQKICSFNLNSLFFSPSTSAPPPTKSKITRQHAPAISAGDPQLQTDDFDGDGDGDGDCDDQIWQDCNNKSSESTDPVALNKSEQLQQRPEQKFLSQKSYSHNYLQGGDDGHIKSGFYWSNLVLTTNHLNSSSGSVPTTRDRVLTRAQLKKHRQQVAANGSLLNNSESNPRAQKLRKAESLAQNCRNHSWTASTSSYSNMGAIKFLGCTNKNRKNRLPTINKSEKGVGNSSAGSSDSKHDGKAGLCRCFTISGANNNIGDNCSTNCDIGSNGYDLLAVKKKVYCFHEAPHYLRFNPHITDGYRGMLRPIECVKSLFWWTNETLNIWTHLFGWVFFLALSVYDFLGLLKLPNIQPLDQMILTGLLLCFQACMLLSSLYHIFCCHSEVSYRRWLSADLLGVSLSLLAIYVSGIYYAFSCVPFWLNFYLVTVGAIFATAMFMQILPIISKKEMVTEERFRWRLVVFGGWAAYGVIPTLHWAYLHGMSGPAVSLLLPRIFGVYIISAAAFFFYVTRIPEKVWPGLVNFVGSSHQIWHILIVAALYHWHNTGMLYLEFRAAHPCTEEYEYLFGILPSEVWS